MIKNVESTSAYCGIDISKDTFDYCIVDQNKQILYQGHLPININSLEQLKKIALENVKQNTIFLMESTAKYHRRVSLFLETAGFEVYVVQPLLIKKYNESKDLRKTKTDKKDAKMIAEYTVDNHNTLYLYKPEYDELKDLLRFYHSLVKDLTAYKNRYKEIMESVFPELLKVNDIYSKTLLRVLHEICVPGDIVKKRISTLDNLLKNPKGKNISLTGKKLKEIAKSSIGISHGSTSLIVRHLIDSINEIILHIETIKKEVEKLTDERFKENKQIVSSIKGIGNIMAMSFLVETKDINLFSSWKKISAYAGIDPCISQSGSSINRKGGISKRGNKYLRSTLFLMAQSVIKWCPRYKQYYKKKRDEGKSYKESIIAVANKLVKLLYSLLNKGMFYSEDYEKSNSLLQVI